MRIFGNELKYFNFDGADRVKTLYELLNPKSRFRNLLNEKVPFQIYFKNTKFKTSVARK